MRSETQLVIALSRTPVSAASRARAKQLLDNGVDWEAVENLAARWRAEPNVFGNLRSEFPSAMTEAVLDSLSALERQSRAHTISRTLLLTELLKRFDLAGIPVMVLKGAAVAIAAYGDYSRRSFSDIDLLVPRGHLAAARDLLLAHGYEPDFAPEMEPALIRDQHALEFSGPRVKVEVHWSLLSRHLGFDIDVDDLWARSLRVQCMDSAMTVLAPEHLFLYLCAHGAKHEWMLFRWICDVAQLASRMSSEEALKVVALAGETNSRRILALALRVVHETFGDEPSPFPPSAFLVERETRKLVQLVKARMEPGDPGMHRLLPGPLERIHPYLAPLAFWIASRERTIDQLRCAARFLFVPAASDASRGRFEKLIRPGRLAANALRRMIQPS